MLAFSICAGAFSFSAALAQVAEAGALARGDQWEVSVDFEADVLPGSILEPSNYTIQGGIVESLRYVTLNNAVILTVSGLLTNDLYSVTIENARRTDNSPIPTITTSFIANPMSWAAIGAQELGFPAAVVAIETNAFDLISGGSVMRAEYDESTFVYERITGNFDKRVRVQSQEPSSAEARAGLMVREATDEGRTRPADPTDPATAFSRYLQVHVNPAEVAFEGATGNNLFQINFRGQTGFTENPEITNNVAPPSSNSWVRLRRIGDRFDTFRGADGTNWVLIGSFTFPTNDFDGAPLPKFSNTVLVGPNYSPELENIPETSGARRSFLAQFRDYGDTGLLPADPPTLAISRVGTEVELQWTPPNGTLQSTTNLLTGPWVDRPRPSPVRVNVDRPHEFFRVLAE